MSDSYVNEYHAERRSASRVNTEFSINYQIISRHDALKDPYSANFAIPRYLQLNVELEELDYALNIQLQSFIDTNPAFGQLLDIFNQKINVIQKAFFDTVVHSILPSPRKIDISESGLSFTSASQLNAGTHLHITLSHPQNDIHICSTVRVVYCEPLEHEGYKVGAYFISLHPKDHAKLSELIDHLHQHHPSNA